VALVLTGILSVSGCGGGDNGQTSTSASSPPTRGAANNSGKGRTAKPTVPPYAANCGNTSYLEFKAKTWSNGCTAGSANLNEVSWQGWNQESATGTGIAGLRGPCVISPKPGPACRGETAYYQARAKVRLSKPEVCSDGKARRRYFARARFIVYMRSGNPFGQPVGWQPSTYTTTEGDCGVD
jgi:hypothetical protein